VSLLSDVDSLSRSRSVRVSVLLHPRPLALFDASADPAVSSVSRTNNAHSLILVELIIADSSVSIVSTMSRLEIH